MSGTGLTEVSGAGMKACTGTGGTGIHIVPKLPEVTGTGIDVRKLPKCPVPVLMSYRTCRSIQ